MIAGSRKLEERFSQRFKDRRVPKRRAISAPLNPTRKKQVGITRRASCAKRKNYAPIADKEIDRTLREQNQSLEKRLRHIVRSRSANSSVTWPNRLTQEAQSLARRNQAQRTRISSR